MRALDHLVLVIQEQQRLWSCVYMAQHVLSIRAYVGICVIICVAGRTLYAVHTVQRRVCMFISLMDTL